MGSLKHCWEAGGASFDKAMLWATACAFFFGFLQSGETTVPSSSAYDPAVHLPIADVSIDSGTTPTKVLLKIKASKNDPFRKRVTVCLGRTNRGYLSGSGHHQLYRAASRCFVLKTGCH